MFMVQFYCSIWAEKRNWTDFYCNNLSGRANRLYDLSVKLYFSHILNLVRPEQRLFFTKYYLTFNSRAGHYANDYFCVHLSMVFTSFSVFIRLGLEILGEF